MLVAHAERCPEHSSDVVRILDALGPGAVLVAMRSPAAEVRRSAANWGDPDDPAQRARLVELLADDAPGVSLAALASLAQLDDPPQEAVRRAAAILADQAVVQFVFYDLTGTILQTAGGDLLIQRID